MAARVVTRGGSIRGVAKQYEICNVTLNRFITKTKELREAGSEKTPTVGYSKHRQVFTSEQERQFRDYLKKASDMFYGLSPKQVG